MRLSLLAAASGWLFAACDCYDAHHQDSGPMDGGADAALDGDTDLDAADARDSSAPAPRCRTGQEPSSCPGNAPYCCAEDFNETSGDSCVERPIPPVDSLEEYCWEHPQPGAAVATSCDDDHPCPPELPWCCTGFQALTYCAAGALLGWRCVDAAGAPAGDTWRIEMDLIRRCEEDQPCPDHSPYCCENLFCAAEPYHGWECALR